MNKQELLSTPSVKESTKGDLSLLFCTSYSQELPDTVKQCRGVIFKGDDLVFKGYSYTDEYTTDDDLSKISLDSYKVFVSHEGTLVRFSYLNGEWISSTHRRFDIFKSRWGSSKSFGDMFAEALQSIYPEDSYNQFLQALDTDKQYMFLLTSNDSSRIVCENGPVSTILQAGSIGKDGVCVLHDDALPFQSAEEIACGSIEELKTIVEDMKPIEYQGAILINTDTMETIKLLNKDYKYFFDLRGNEPSIKFQYLKVRTDYAKYQDYCDLYCSHQEEFDLYENTIYVIVKDIYDAYVQRFIYKNKDIRIPPQEYYVMKRCHQWHMEDRKNHTISIDRVMEEFGTLKPSCINRLIKTRLRAIAAEEKAEEFRETEC